MKTKKQIQASIILIALHLILTMTFSCGIMNKQKSKSNTSKNKEIRSSESTSEMSDQQRSELKKAWMQQLQYSKAFIHSDSTITYHPNGGFELSRGSLLLTQINQKESTSEEGTLQNQSNTIEIKSARQKKEEEQNKAVLSNKEKSFPYALVFLLLIVLIFILLYKRIKRALKGTKFTI